MKLLSSHVEWIHAIRTRSLCLFSRDPTKVLRSCYEAVTRLGKFRGPVTKLLRSCSEVSSSPPPPAPSPRRRGYLQLFGSFGKFGKSCYATHRQKPWVSKVSEARESRDDGIRLGSQNPIPLGTPDSPRNSRIPLRTPLLQTGTPLFPSSE